MSLHSVLTYASQLSASHRAALMRTITDVHQRPPATLHVSTAANTAQMATATATAAATSTATTTTTPWSLTALAAAPFTVVTATNYAPSRLRYTSPSSSSTTALAAATAGGGEREPLTPAVATLLSELMQLITAQPHT